MLGRITGSWLNSPLHCNITTCRGVQLRADEPVVRSHSWVSSVKIRVWESTSRFNTRIVFIKGPSVTVVIGINVGPAVTSGAVEVESLWERQVDGRGSTRSRSSNDHHHGTVGSRADRLHTESVSGVDIKIVECVTIRSDICHKCFAIIQIITWSIASPADGDAGLGSLVNGQAQSRHAWRTRSFQSEEHSVCQIIAISREHSSTTAIEDCEIGFIWVRSCNPAETHGVSRTYIERMTHATSTVGESEGTHCDTVLNNVDGIAIPTIIVWICTIDCNRTHIFWQASIGRKTDRRGPFANSSSITYGLYWHSVCGGEIKACQGVRAGDVVNNSTIYINIERSFIRVPSHLSFITSCVVNSNACRFKATA